MISQTICICYLHLQNSGDVHFFILRLQLIRSDFTNCERKFQSQCNRLRARKTKKGRTRRFNCVLLYFIVFCLKKMINKIMKRFCMDTLRDVAV